MDRKKSLILILLSSVCFVLSSPGFFTPWLAFIFLVPGLFVYSRVSVKEAFFLGLIQGIFFYGGANYWFVYSAVVMFNMSVFFSAVLYVFMAAAFYGLYFSFFSTVTTWIFQQGANRPYYQKILFPSLVIPLLWMTVEIFRGLIFPQFNITGITSFFYRNPVFLQAVSFTGEHLFSYIIILINLGLYFLISPFVAHNGFAFKKNIWNYVPLAVSVFLAAAVFIYGFSVRGHFIKAGQSSDEIISLQLNISHKKKWKRKFYGEILTQYLKATENALTKQTKIVLWPETAINFYPQRESVYSARLLNFADAKDIIILAGGPEYEVTNAKTKYYNAVFMIGNSEIRPVYRKEKLLPFAEYCPVDALMFLYKMANNGKTNQFYSYENNQNLRVGERSIGMAICYESTFPRLIKKRSKGTDLVVIFSDDVWLGNTSGPEQHLATEVIRAIENRTWIIASVNSGISALISPEGDILQRVPFGKKGIVRWSFSK